ncbi:MAG TPA: DUF3488 and transglutaminase-like domain-containing protein, partial [Actinomycetota bacterium]|nr:DUF3488 and transglutaminase-like domain-containing protein [Actinomycetota bacterium]
PIWTWHGRERAVTRSATAGARKVALVAVAVAVLLPGILPGFRSSALVDFSTTNPDRIGLDPFVSIKAQLQERTPINLFTVTSVDDQETPVAAYWRLYALDRFNGVTWSSSDPLGAGGRVMSSPATFPSLLPSGLPPVHQTYRFLTDIPQPYLPMAYPPRTIDLPIGPIHYDQNLISAVAGRDLNAGLEYTVTSGRLFPTPQQLDQVSFADPAAYLQDTKVPDSVPDEVAQIARRWTAQAATPYEQVYTIEQRLLSSPFQYSLDVKPRADADALVDFLTKTHRGFCQQFATAMATLVRELGIPARVVVGYLPGKQLDATFTVTTKQSHSWVEVLFPGYGWLPFDPTPGTSKPTPPQGSYLSPDTSSSGPNRGGGETQTQGGRTTTTSDCGPGLTSKLCTNPYGTARRPRGLGPDAIPALQPADAGRPSPYRRVVWVVLALAGMLALLFPLAKKLWRRSLLRRIHDPRHAVLAAYRVFDGEATDLGLGRRQGETLAEHRRRLAGSVRFSDGHLGRLTSMASTAAYSERSVSASDARAARRDARVAIQDLRRHASLSRRIAGVYRPGL